MSFSIERSLDQWTFFRSASSGDWGFVNNTKEVIRLQQVCASPKPGYLKYTLMTRTVASQVSDHQRLANLDAQHL